MGWNRYRPIDGKVGWKRWVGQESGVAGTRFLRYRTWFALRGSFGIGDQTNKAGAKLIPRSSCGELASRAYWLAYWLRLTGVCCSLQACNSGRCFDHLHASPSSQDFVLSECFARHTLLQLQCQCPFTFSDVTPHLGAMVAGERESRELADGGAKSVTRSSPAPTGDCLST